jgi:hypothetical protein
MVLSSAQPAYSGGGTRLAETQPRLEESEDSLFVGWPLQSAVDWLFSSCRAAYSVECVLSIA